MSNYNTLAEVDALLKKTIYYNDWKLFVDKEAAIYMATNIIDQLKYSGSKTDSEQENEFPRDDNVEVPEVVKRAHALIASAISRGADPELDYEAKDVTSTAFSSMRTTRKNEKEDHVVAGVPSVTAWRLLLPYLEHDLSLVLTRN
jgi:hypothetical protein